MDDCKKPQIPGWKSHRKSTVSGDAEENPRIPQFRLFQKINYPCQMEKPKPFVNGPIREWPHS
jgi:hypothetical protein